MFIVSQKAKIFKSKGEILAPSGQPEAVAFNLQLKLLFSRMKTIFNKKIKSFQQQMFRENMQKKASFSESNESLQPGSRTFC